MSVLVAVLVLCKDTMARSSLMKKSILLETCSLREDFMAIMVGRWQAWCWTNSWALTCWGTSHKAERHCTWHGLLKSQNSTLVTHFLQESHVSSDRDTSLSLSCTVTLTEYWGVKHASLRGHSQSKHCTVSHGSESLQMTNFGFHKK